MHFKKSIFLGLLFCFLGFSCKSVSFSDLRPSSRRIQKLIPKLKPKLDKASFESMFVAETSNIKYFQTGFFSTRTIKGKAFTDARTIFERELGKNIYQIDGQPKGSIEMRIINVNNTPHSDWFFMIPTIYFYCIFNLLGMPFYSRKMEIEVEYTIRNKKGETIRIYDIGAKSKTWIALYYGYSRSIDGAYRKNVIECIKSSIAQLKDLIELDYEILVEKLNNQ